MFYSKYVKCLKGKFYEKNFMEKMIFMLFEIVVICSKWDVSLRCTIDTNIFTCYSVECLFKWNPSNPSNLLNNISLQKGSL